MSTLSEYIEKYRAEHGDLDAVTEYAEKLAQEVHERLISDTGCSMMVRLYARKKFEEKYGALKADKV